MKSRDLGRTVRDLPSSPNHLPYPKKDMVIHSYLNLKRVFLCHIPVLQVLVIMTLKVICSKAGDDIANLIILGMDYVDKSKPTSAFVPSGRGRVPYPDPSLTKRNIPGPLDYSPKVDYTPPLLAAKPSFTFVSKSKRDSFLCQEK